MRLAGQICLALWVAVLVIGTVIRFTYTLGPGEAENGCFFANAGTMSIGCTGFPGADIVAFIFSIAWYWTWGIWWAFTEIPYSWPVLAPAVLTLWFAFRYLASPRQLPPE